MKDFFHIDYLKTLIDSQSPNSSSRFLSILTVGTVLYTWMVLSLYHQAMQEIPTGVFTFVGLVITGGVIKRFAEPIGRPEVGQRDSLSEKKEDDK